MSPSDPEREANERRRLWQMTGMGMEFAGAAIGMGALGWWIDREIGTEPWAMAIGGLLGVSGGMYLLIRSALQAQNEALRQQKRDQRNQDVKSSDKH